MLRGCDWLVGKATSPVTAASCVGLRRPAPSRTGLRSTQGCEGAALFGFPTTADSKVPQPLCPIESRGPLNHCQRGNPPESAPREPRGVHPVVVQVAGQVVLGGRVRVASHTGPRPALIRAAPARTASQRGGRPAPTRPPRSRLLSKHGGRRCSRTRQAAPGGGWIGAPAGPGGRRAREGPGAGGGPGGGGVGGGRGRGGAGWRGGDLGQRGRSAGLPPPPLPRPGPRPPTAVHSAVLSLVPGSTAPLPSSPPYCTGPRHCPQYLLRTGTGPAAALSAVLC